MLGSGHRSRVVVGASLFLSIVTAAPALAWPGDNGPFAVTLHSHLPDGRSDKPQIWTMRSDGSDLHRQFSALEESNEDPRWSPDGEWLAFTRGGSLVVARTDGSASRIVAQPAYGRISWSPDGTRLLFGRSYSGPRREIWMVGADGTDEHQVYEGPVAMEPAWSPSGDRIAFSQQDPTTNTSDREVFTMDTDGSDVRQVTFNDDPISETGATPVADFSPAWSPDGEHLVVVSTRDAELDCDHCASDLYVSDADGSNIERIHLDGDQYWPSWAPDGSALAFVQMPTPPFDPHQGSMRFDRYDLATGKVTHLEAADFHSTLDWGVEPGSVPLADLRSSVSVGDSTSGVGDTTAVTAVLVNDGPRAAQDTALEVRLPEGSAAAAEPPGCTGTTTITCGLGAVPAGESRSVVIDVSAGQVGAGEISARAISTTPDPNVLDNRSSVPWVVCTQVGGDGDEVLLGTEGHDVLCGGGGTDELRGAGGDDVLIGGPGDDVVDGGQGQDATSYAVAARGVRVDLSRAVAVGEGTDDLRSVEDASGTRYGDVLTGGTGRNTLLGGGGSDRIDAGGGADEVDGGTGGDLLAPGTGDDQVRGGTGRDTLSFAAARRGVSADLLRRWTTGQGTDRLWLLENVRGSRFRDTIVGSVVANLVTGRGGRDEVKGKGGNDRVDGGSGSDSLAGGDGIDRLRGGAGADHCDQEAGRGRSTSCES